ncbi:nodulation protein NolB [Rhizobium grahamii]|nr:nodulation protein NolB [Rhizobium grahamii]
MIDSLSSVGRSSACGPQAKFEHCLAQAAASTNNEAPSAKAIPATVPPAVEAQRGVTRPTPLGHRVLQMLSSMHWGNAVTPASPGHDVILLGDDLVAPADRLPVETGPEGMRLSSPPHGPDTVEAMISELRDIYNGATEVSLVSKSVNGITSSVNKIIKEG